MRRNAMRNDRIISSKRDVPARGVSIPGTTSGLSASLFFPARGNDLPGRSKRTRARRCDSDSRVLFGCRRADKPLKGLPCPLLQRYINFSLVILRVPPPCHRRYPYRRTLLHLPATLFVFKPLRTRPRAFCTSRLRDSLRADKRPFYIPALGMEEIIA